MRVTLDTNGNEVLILANRLYLILQLKKYFDTFQIRVLGSMWFRFINYGVLVITLVFLIMTSMYKT